MTMEKARIAHMLMVHKNPEQVNVLLRQLAGEGQSDVYVHVDAKCPDSFVEALWHGPTVTFLTERISVSWGDYNNIEATFLLMNAVLATGIAYDYLALNSGQCLLIRDGLPEFLAKHRGKVFVEAEFCGPGDFRHFFQQIRWPKKLRALYDGPLNPYRALRGLLRILFLRGINLLPNPHKLPEGWTLHRGSQWICVPKEAAEYILEYTRAHPEYEDAFRHALTPDMLYFQTLLMHSPFKDRVTDATITHFTWGTGRRGVNHPVLLTMKDVPRLEALEGRYFARKFESGADPEVIAYFGGKYAVR